MTSRTEDGKNLRKQVLRVIPSESEVIHEGDAVRALLVGMLEKEVGKALQVDVVLGEVGSHQEVLHGSLEPSVNNFNKGTLTFAEPL